MKEEGKKNILRWNRHKGSQTHCNGEAMVVNTDIETMYINIRVQYCTCRVPVVISVIILNRNVLVCVKGSKGDVCQAECRFKCSDRGSVEHCRLAVISFHEIIQDVEVEISTRGIGGMQADFAAQSALASWRMRELSEYVMRFF